jgi:UDP-N-acetylglucosamine transferase subunit ALG13
VIFATCGSSHFRFDRMMEALAMLPASELYVQNGPAQPPPGARAVPFLPFDILMDNITEADVVISHAGVGSILCAIRAGHTPVIFPRLKRYHETVDDHQAELAVALAEQGSAIVAWNGDELVVAVTAVPPRGEGRALGPTPLVDAVRTSIVSGPAGH